MESHLTYPDFRQRCKDIVISYLESPDISNELYLKEINTLCSRVNGRDVDIMECADKALCSLSAIYQHYLYLCDTLGLFSRPKTSEERQAMRANQILVMQGVKSLFKKGMHFGWNFI